VNDLYLVNGKVYTQDARMPAASAVAISGNRFRAVGSDDQIRSLAGPGAQIIDLGGRRVLPGLNDGHFHYWDWALALRQLPLSTSPSLAAVREQVAQAAQTPGTGWVLGRGWNETLWLEQRLPTRADLDDVAGPHPVMLYRNDMHLAVVNSQALQAAGITADTPNPPGGVIGRDAAGQPNGLLADLAMNLASAVVPPVSEEDTVDAMRAGITLLHRLGLTGLHDYRVMGGICGVPAFRAWQRLEAAGKLALRVWMHLPGERTSEAIALGLRTGFGNDYLRVGHLKFFVDGSQGARTAWMLEPYEDSGCGIPLTPLAEIGDAVVRAELAGWAVAIHSIGDRANRELISTLEQARETVAQHRPISGAVTAPPKAPHRIEHVQMLRSEDLPRLARLGVVASVQPLQATDDIAMVEQSVGQRAQYAYTFQSLLRAGVPLALGSDCPVADPNPFWSIHAAVTRQHRDGTPVGGWYPEQRLTIQQAVWGFTMGTATASGRQAELGSIVAGKLADLVVLDRDILAIEPAEIAEARADLTVFDGCVVFER
jgi:predicted amidohydrolase YtcJ